MQKINHRDLEQSIGQGCDCGDYLKLKVAGYYPNYNNIIIAARRGENHFRLSARGPKSDISQALPLSGRYLVIGDPDDVDQRIFDTCVLQNKTDVWLQIPDAIYVSRLLIAGAIRVISLVNQLPPQIAATPEYKQAVADRRVIEFLC